MNDIAEISSRLREKLNSEIEADERIVWADMPIPRFFTPGSLYQFLFAIPWTAFAIYWTCAATRFKIPDFNEAFDFFPLFGLIFVFVGLGMLSSPFRQFRKAFKTVYAVTNKRAIIIEIGWSTTTRSFPPETLQDISRKEKRNGTGDIFFSPPPERGFFAPSIQRGQIQPIIGFLGIRNPKDVEKMLRKLVSKS